MGARLSVDGNVTLWGCDASTRSHLAEYSLFPNGTRNPATAQEFGVLNTTALLM